jgi:cytochrome c-type biogenesis protein CcmH/NrfF
MTNNPAPRRKKAALVLMWLAPIFAFSPLIVVMIEVRIIAECSVMPNYCGGIAYFVLLTVPIGLLVFIIGLIMLLAKKRTKHDSK